jgi:O-antigen ligase
VADATLVHAGLAPATPVRRPQRIAIRHLLLRVALFLALFRSTSMWFGYPSAQSDLASINPLPQQLMLYSLLPMVGLYVLIDYRFVLLAIRRVRAMHVVILILLVASIAISMDKRASFMGFMAVSTISAPVILHMLRYGAAETYRMVVYFCVAAIYINALYTVALPSSAVMTGVLAGSVRGMFIHKNDFAQFMAVCLVLIATVPRSTRLSWVQLHRAAATVVGLGLLVAARSASAVVLAVMGCLGFVCVRFISRLRGAGIRLYVTCVLGGIGVAFVYVTLVYFLELILTGLGRDATLTGRTGLWHVLYRVSLETPWLGHGFAMFRQLETMSLYWTEFGWAARSTHNTYLELALNIGYPATVLVVLAIVRELLPRIVRLHAASSHGEVLVRQSVTILLVLLGSMTQAGYLLAPTMNWLLLLSCLGPIEPLGSAPARGAGRPGTRPIYLMPRLALRPQAGTKSG